jgi:hypothetical protein
MFRLVGMLLFYIVLKNMQIKVAYFRLITYNRPTVFHGHALNDSKVVATWSWYVRHAGIVK